MAIAPADGQEYAKAIRRVYDHTERVILEKIAKRVSKGGPIEDPHHWLDQKLAEVRRHQTEVDAILKKLTQVGPSAVSDLVVQSYLSGIISADSDLIGYGAMLEHEPLEITAKDLKDPLKVTAAFGATHTAAIAAITAEAMGGLKGAHVQMLRQARDGYRDIVNEIATAAIAGADTRLQATQRAINKFADKGIGVFTDKAGRNWDIATYAEMATRTAMAQAHIQGHINRMTQQGHDLVIVSHHSEPSDLCQPHQGRIYSISGKDTRYKSLSWAISDGLFHPNCRHTINAYIAGLTEVPNIEADPEGYKKRQKQRQMERQVRKWKKRDITAITPAERAKAAAKVKYWQKELREYTAEHKLARMYDREKIYSRALGKGPDPSKPSVMPSTNPAATIKTMDELVGTAKKEVIESSARVATPVGKIVAKPPSRFNTDDIIRIKRESEWHKVGVETINHLTRAENKTILGHLNWSRPFEEWDEASQELFLKHLDPSKRSLFVKGADDIKVKPINADVEEVSLDDLIGEMADSMADYRMSHLDNLEDFAKPTHSDLTSKWKEKGYEIDMSGLPIDTATEISKRFEQVIERFPAAFRETPKRGGIVNIEVTDAIEDRDMEKDMFAYVYGRTVRLNRDMLKDKKFLDEYKLDVDSGWHPVGTDGYSAITHEFAHVIDTMATKVGRKRRLKGISGDDRDIAERTQERALAKLGMTKDDISTELSRYAATEPKEFFAEAFAELMDSPNPRPMARAFGEALDEELADLFDGIPAPPIAKVADAIPSVDDLDPLLRAQLSSMGKDTFEMVVDKDEWGKIVASFDGDSQAAYDHYQNEIEAAIKREKAEKRKAAAAKKKAKAKATEEPPTPTSAPAVPDRPEPTQQALDRLRKPVSKWEEDHWTLTPYKDSEVERLVAKSEKDATKWVKQISQSTISPDTAKLYKPYINPDGSVDLDRYFEDAKRKLVDMVDEAKPTILTPPEALADILKSGRYKTLHETGTSRGSKTASSRKTLERRIFSTPPSAKEERPVYGLLDRPDGQGTQAGRYGTVKVRLKQDKIKERTTITVGDSLGEDTIGLRMSDPEARLLGDAHILEADDATRLVPEGGQYTEIQVHGGVKLEDIDYIDIEIDDLDDDMIDTLKGFEEQGVKVRVWNMLSKARGGEFDGSREGMTPEYRPLSDYLPKPIAKPTPERKFTIAREEYGEGDIRHAIYELMEQGPDEERAGEIMLDRLMAGEDLTKWDIDDIKGFLPKKDTKKIKAPEPEPEELPVATGRLREAIMESDDYDDFAMELMDDTALTREFDKYVKAHDGDWDKAFLKAKGRVLEDEIKKAEAKIKKIENPAGPNIIIDRLEYTEAEVMGAIDQLEKSGGYDSKMMAGLIRADIRAGRRLQPDAIKRIKRHLPEGRKITMVEPSAKVSPELREALDKHSTYSGFSRTGLKDTDEWQRLVEEEYMYDEKRAYKELRRRVLDDRLAAAEEVAMSTKPKPTLPARGKVHRGIMDLIDEDTDDLDGIRPFLTRIQGEELDEIVAAFDGDTTKTLNWLKYGTTDDSEALAIDLSRMEPLERLKFQLKDARYQTKWELDHFRLGPREEYLENKHVWAKTNARPIMEKHGFTHKDEFGIVRYDYDRYFEESNKRFKKMVDEGMPTIRVSPKVLDLVMNNDPTDRRFKTQFETGTSNGMLSTEGRGRYEYQMLNAPKDMDPKLRPIYGLMDGPEGQTDKGDWYGSIKIRLKMTDDLKSRTTLTIGDSLDYDQAGMRYDNPLTELATEGNIWDAEDVTKVHKRSYTEIQVFGGVGIDDIDYVDIQKWDIYNSDLGLINVLKQYRDLGVKVRVWDNLESGSDAKRFKSEWKTLDDFLETDEEVQWRFFDE